MNESLVFSLAKVVAATAWADGKVTLDEINCMKDLLFRLPDLTEKDWKRLQMYIDSPVGEAERERLISDLKSQIKTDDEIQLVRQTMESLVQSDGELSEDERVILDEVIQEMGSPESGSIGKLSGLFKPSLKRRSEAVAASPNREDYFEDFINNRIYYEIKQRTADQGGDFNLSEQELRKLALAGGICSRVARVDQDVSKAEYDRISQGIQRGWGLPPEKADLVAEVALSDISEDLDYLRLCWTFFDVSDESERLRLLAALFSVAAADGAVSFDETEEIRSISNSLKLSHKQFIDAKLKIPRENRES
ncbi:MAG TPA: TerB family tellurite resistance protein [Anaerolineales bacterium]|nr:TerB family tellurite resistance protein [Anaerolineales bacterium]